MYYLETGHDKHTRFSYALALAVAVHVALLLTISFTANTPTNYSTPQFDVMLATRPSEKSSQHALKIATTNQENSGDNVEIDQSRHHNNSSFAVYSQQQLLMQTPEAQREQPIEVLAAAARVLRTQAAEPTAYVHGEVSLRGISPEVDRLNAELMSLQAELDNQTRTYIALPNVRRLSAASATESAAAAYLLDWQQRLEIVGNYYYPKASVRYGIYGSLRILVVIQQDGSLKDAQILSSSGYPMLDKAAIKIVRMASPYASFPPELRAITDKLEIVRTWHFRENQLSSP